MHRLRHIQFFAILALSIVILTACAGSLDDKDDDETNFTEEAPSLTQIEIIEMVQGGPALQHNGNRLSTEISPQAYFGPNGDDFFGNPFLKPEQFKLSHKPNYGPNTVRMKWSTRDADLGYYIYESNTYSLPFTRIGSTASANYTHYIPDALGGYYYAISAIRQLEDGSLTESDLSDQQFVYLYRDLLKTDQAIYKWQALAENGYVFKGGIASAVSQNSFALSSNHISFENFLNNKSPYIRLHAQSNSEPLNLYYHNTKTNHKLVTVYRSNYYSPTLHDYEFQIEFKHVRLTYNPRRREAYVNGIPFVPPSSMSPSADANHQEQEDELNALSRLTNIHPGYFNVISIFYEPGKEQVKIRVNNRETTIPFSAFNLNPSTVNRDSPVRYKIKTRSLRTLIQLFTVYGDT